MPQSQRPNFLLIMCDQLRADCISADDRAWPGVSTPNIDRIAQRGVRFRRAYTEVPVCVPARVNVLTGLHAHQLGIMDNQPTPGPEVPTLPGLLTDLGYFTAAIGKMHFRPPRNHYGFQRMLLSEEIPRYRVDDEYLLYLRDRGYGHVLEPHGLRHEQYYQPQVSQLPA
ncbi:MAG: sulfatase-like hydrolase/transferase, partial [Chloroflexota bacterium]